MVKEEGSPGTLKGGYIDVLYLPLSAREVVMYLVKDRINYDNSPTDIMS